MPVLDLDKIQTTNDYPQVIEIFPPNFFADFYKSFDISSLAIKTMQEAFRAISESALLSFTQSFSAVNKNVGQMLAAQIASVKLMDTFKSYYSPAIIIDSEPEAILSLPLQKTSNKARLGILMTKIGTFKYKRKTLSKLSMKNSEGKLLALFMNSDLFASDDDIRKITNAEDNREFSWVLRNLKYKFRHNGLRLILERIWNPNGYIIQNITYLQ